MPPLPEPHLPVETSLPSLSATVSRLIALYSDSDYSVDAVITILEADPAITARILRLANSAYYGFGSQVTTLQRAVVLLGAITVQAVALGAQLLNAWGSAGPPEKVEAIWVCSYLRATAARHLGMRLPPQPQRSAPDALFLHGLLAHVGKLLFLHQAADQYAGMLADCAATDQLCQCETEQFGWDHAEAGAALLQAWRLPPRTVAVVRHQYRGQLRSEVQHDWEVLNAASTACGMQPPLPSTLPAELLHDTEQFLERKRPEAQAFYTAIS